MPGQTDRTGRAPVEPGPSLKGQPEVFVIGDVASVPWKDSVTVPGIAPAAKQEGRDAADVISAAVRGGKKPAPLRYRHRGNLATIGRDAAIVDFGRVKLTGRIAWRAWGSPTSISSTFGRGALLITGLAPLFTDLKMPNDGSRFPADSHN